MTNKISLIGAALGWGAQIIETEFGPQALKDFGVHTHVSQLGIECQWQCILHTEHKAEEGFVEFEHRTPWIIDINQRLAKAVSSAIQQDATCVAIGGDHSMAIGTWSGITTTLEAKQNFGLIWFDAHMDANTPETSPSHAIHGMPVAALLGHGIPELVNLYSDGPKISPQHLVLIGIRSFEQGEAALLEELGVKIYFMEEVKQRGLEIICEEAKAIALQAQGGFGVSIDLDGFDPEDAPGVGSPEKDGFHPEAFISAFKKLVDHPKFKALEIAEYNPTLDKEKKTAGLTQDIIASLVKD